MLTEALDVRGSITESVLVLLLLLVEVLEFCPGIFQVRNVAMFLISASTWIEEAQATHGYTHVLCCFKTYLIFQWRVRLLKDKAGVILYFSFCQQMP